MFLLFINIPSNLFGEERSVQSDRSLRWSKKYLLDHLSRNIIRGMICQKILLLGMKRKNAVFYNKERQKEKRLVRRIRL